MSTNPFDALGLPTRPDLTDEQVRALAGHRTATHRTGPTAGRWPGTPPPATPRHCRWPSSPTVPRCRVSRPSGRGN